MSHGISNWRLYSCRRGVLASRGDRELLALIDENTSNAAGSWDVYPGKNFKLLPPSMSDTFLPYHLRLPVELSEENFAEISYDGDVSLASTVFGPAQEKRSNQDFCLCGAIEDDKKRRLAFSVVCDGVSTGAFWSQRGAQLACFSAYRALRQLWCERLSEVERITKDDVGQFRSMCAAELAEAVRNDRDSLLYDVHGYDPEYTEGVFRRNRGRSHAWHNSTLIVAAVGHNGALIAYAGDGGISLLRRTSNGEESVIRILQSTEDLEISNFVSPEIGANEIDSAVIDTTDAEYVQIISCSDGVDRTLHRASISLEDFVKEFNSSEALGVGLDNLPERFQELAERDNYALALIAWPQLERRVRAVDEQQSVLEFSVSGVGGSPKDISA